MGSEGESHAEGLGLEETPVPDLWPMVCTSPTAQRSPEDLCGRSVQKGMAQKEVCPMEQRQRRLLQVQLSTKEAGGDPSVQEPI